MKVTIQVIKAFSIGQTGGNPAGVVFNADDLSNEIKQQVATKAGFPETAFLSSSLTAGYKLDFFTPTKQIAHCGHATIASFSYMKKIGKIDGDHSSKETIDGIREIRFIDGLAFMEQRSPVITRIPEVTDPILSSLRLTIEDLAEGLLPAIVNTGNSFLIVPVKDQQILAGINYDREAVYEISEKYGLIGFYVYTTAGLALGLDATARMFGPYYGIDEESGTGMAAGPLASFLYQVEDKKKDQFFIEQGRFMRPASTGLIRVQLETNEGNIVRLFAGGDAYVSGQTVVEIN